MIGILLVTHGELGNGILGSAELLVGAAEQVEVLSLIAGQDIRQLKEQAEQKLDELDSGEGVLVLVDIPGGSPYNVVAQCIRGRQAECITGVNLPMLVEAIDSRDQHCLGDLAKACVASGIASIVNVREKLHIV